MKTPAAEEPPGSKRAVKPILPSQFSGIVSLAVQAASHTDQDALPDPCLVGVVCSLSVAQDGSLEYSTPLNDSDFGVELVELLKRAYLVILSALLDLQEPDKIGQHEDMKRLVSVFVFLVERFKQHHSRLTDEGQHTVYALLEDMEILEEAIADLLQGIPEQAVDADAVQELTRTAAYWIEEALNNS